MSYEIPQQLRYKERIVFGLTLEQLAYAGTFGAIILIIFRLNISIYARIAISLFPVGLAVAFMYGNLWRWIKTLFAFTQFRRATMLSPDMQRFMRLKAVANQCYHVETRRGTKKVAVLQVDPMNFRIKPAEERESIIESFQKFLNALDFPIQIAMYTDDLNLNSYIQEVAQKVLESKNKRFLELFGGHKHHLEALMRERLSVNRRFLIIIPETTMGLDSQITVVREFLDSMKLKTVRLGGRQLIKVLIKFFNNPRGRTALLKQLKTIYTITAPEFVENSTKHIKINDHYNRIIATTGYPRLVEEGFLDKIITAAGNFDLSIHIEPFPIEQTIVLLNRELQKQRADLYALQMKQSFSPSLEIQHNDTRSVLDGIQKGEEKLFNVSLYINVKAKDLKELETQTRTIESKLNSILMIPHVTAYRMAPGIRSMLPFALNSLAIRRNITTRALSAFFPFTSPFLVLEKGGVFLGLNKNKLPIIKDIFSLANANGAILATSGSGKSYTAKLIISRYLMNGTKVIIIDPQSEYTKLADMFGGSVITISRDSKTIINPLDLLGHTYVEKRLSVMDMFRVMFGELSEVQKAILDRAVSRTYDRRGITEEHYHDKAPPTIGDLYNELERMSHQSSVYEKTTYVALMNRLRMYVDGVFSFVNRPTKLEVDNDMVVFNIGNMPKQVKPLMMFLILDYVYSKMKADRKRKLLVIDEAWSLLQGAGEEGYVFEVVKTCRKWNLGLLLITQDVEDLLNSKAGRAVLSNTSYNILLRQKAAVMDAVQDVFHLSATERDHLLTANVGDGLLMMENDHQEIKIVASTEEHNAITTKPDDLLAVQANVPPELSVQKRRMLIELDLRRGFYKKSALKPEEVEFLLKNNYVESRHVPLRSTAHSIFLVKKVGSHTPEHTFLLHAIHEELLKYTTKVQTDENSRKDSINPDIIFTNERGEQVALEIETGSNLKYNGKYLERKTALLDKRYPNRWHFVLTNAWWRRRYTSNFGGFVMLRTHLLRFLKKQFPKHQDNTTPRGLTHSVDGKSKKLGRSEKQSGQSKRGAKHAVRHR